MMVVSDTCGPFYRARTSVWARLPSRLSASTITSFFPERKVSDTTTKVRFSSLVGLLFRAHETVDGLRSEMCGRRALEHEGQVRIRD